MIEGLERHSSDSDVFGLLLHDLCQPLTTLRCSLELSLDEFSETQSGPVSTALEQADRAIETVQLIREYLELERGVSPVGSVALAPAVHAALEQLSVVAEAHEVPLLASGTSAATLTVNEFWLHRALHYLIGSEIEAQSPGNAVAVLMEDNDSGSVLSVHGICCPQFNDPQNQRTRVAGHLRRTRIAIARHVFASAGASLAVYPGQSSSVVLRVREAGALARRISA